MAWKSKDPEYNKKRYRKMIDGFTPEQKIDLLSQYIRSREGK